MTRIARRDRYREALDDVDALLCRMIADHVAVANDGPYDNGRGVALIDARAAVRKLAPADSSASIAPPEGP